MHLWKFNSSSDILNNKCVNMSASPAKAKTSSTNLSLEEIFGFTTPNAEDPTLKADEEPQVSLITRAQPVVEEDPQLTQLRGTMILISLKSKRKIHKIRIKRQFYALYEFIRATALPDWFSARVLSLSPKGTFCRSDVLCIGFQKRERLM